MECFAEGVMGNEGKYAWRKQRCVSSYAWGDYGKDISGSYLLSAHMILYDNIAITPSGGVISSGSCTETYSGDRDGTVLHGYWFYNGKFYGVYFNGTVKANPDTSYYAPAHICYGAVITVSVETDGYTVGDSESAYPTPPSTVADGAMFYTKITA